MAPMKVWILFIQKPKINVEKAKELIEFASESMERIVSLKTNVSRETSNLKGMLYKRLYTF